MVIHFLTVLGGILVANVLDFDIVVSEFEL